MKCIFYLAVFVQNRANHQDFELQSMQAMQQTLDKLLKDSKLKYKGKQWGHGGGLPLLGALPPLAPTPHLEGKNWQKSTVLR